MTRTQFVIALTGWVAFVVAVLQPREPGAVAGEADGSAQTAGPSPCPADIAPAGGDGVVDVGDLLLVLADWGACPICPELAEPNDECPGVYALPSVGSSGGGQAVQWNSSSLTAGDVDLFRFTANETDSTCSCCDQFCLDEDFLVTVSLTVPAGATGSLLLRVDDVCSTDTTGAVAVAPGNIDSISFWVDGDCGGPANTYTRYILVTGANGSVSSCAPYSLNYSFAPGCQ